MAYLQAKAYLLYPLLAACLFAVSAIAMKASSNHGGGRRRTIVMCNCFMAVAFLVLYDWSSFPSLPSPVWPIVALGVLFVLGQALTVLAVAHGEVSSVTPVFGVKVILVALLVAVLFREPVLPLTWLAAVLAAIGIACLQIGEAPANIRRNIGAMLLAFSAALSFAAFDAMNQYWSPIIGFGRLVPPAIVVAALLSLLFLLKTEAQSSSISTRAWVYMSIGAAFFALQGLVLITSIGVFGDAAGANVAYSTRGLWGIALVWLIGRWFQNTELVAMPPRVIAAKVIGATLTTAATVLLFL